MEQKEVEQLTIIENEAKVAFKEIIQTHASWVLITKSYAYKIKQPLKTSFLDYSTLSKRKYYCEKELFLNKRLAEEIYIRVVPVLFYEGNFIVDGTKGAIVDYAVMMNKMNHRRQMDILLKEGKVTTFDIEKIAQIIVNFHENAQIVTLNINEEKLKNDFNDISTILPYIKHHLDVTYLNTIEKACLQSNEFIKKNIALMRERVTEGFYRDCHGDLHAKNVILENEPIIFDCIEFNDSLRRIDVLNEIAFFCMELEIMNKDVLSNYFLKKYMAYSSFELSPVLENLLLYYKMYKANIRAKVIALQLFNQRTNHDPDALVPKLKEYLDQMGYYCNKLKQG